ncbi:MAG: tRNA pseudouridine(55) synthase TruB [Muribaculaceae bacterium]|nr:tRNA pseudouridine(55) synthase TruB [Muribaculaceae bacterium]
MLNPVEGEIFCVDKPLRLTSFAIVKRVRGVLRSHLNHYNLKVGHAGTLDPLATGVLIIVTGHATKRIEELQSGVKEYIAHIRLGETTPSFDLETEVDATFPWEHITREQVEQVLKQQFTGSIEQVPPAFSACKVDGKPAYKLARRGQDVSIQPKTLVIDEIELLECRLPDIVVRVVCSKGTYIRALARDIGLALGSGAHLTGLRRTRVGEVSVDQCQSLDALLEELHDQQYVSPEQAEQERVERERSENRARALKMKEKRNKHNKQ